MCLLSNILLIFFSEYICRFNKIKIIQKMSFFTEISIKWNGNDYKISNLLESNSINDLKSNHFYIYIFI
jgi:hypothetical protein